MSFPHISQSSDSFHNLVTLSTSEDLLYLLSFKYTDGLAERSVFRNLFVQDEIKGLEAYSDLVDFQKETYLKLRKELIYSIDDQSRSLVRGIVNSRNEYFTRSSMGFQKIADYRFQNPIIIMQEFQPIPQNIFIQCSSILVSPTMNSNPSKWPWQLNEFLQSLRRQPFGSLFYEPEYIRSDIQFNLERLANQPDIKGDLAQQLIDVQFQLSIREATVSSLLKTCLLAEKLGVQPNDFQSDLKQFPVPLDEQPLHYMKTLCDSGGFHVSYLSHFVKLSFNSVAFASSEAYLYIFVSSSNGVMLKVGTGECGTQQGQVYLEKKIKRQEEIVWVYLQGKLYLRSHSKEAGTIEVICPNTFQTLSIMNLHCPDIFQHPSLQIINKNYPLLTDGERLYIVGRRLTVQRTDMEEENQPMPQKTQQELKAQLDQQVKKREEKLKVQQKKKPAEAKDQPQPTDDHTIKLMEYILYEFDVLNPEKGEFLEEEQESLSEQVDEIYQSFQMYFTKKECQRALNLNKNDIQNAVQWLTEEGESERNKTTISFQKKTLLAQAEVTSDISAKQLKTNQEIVCKENSILFPNQVSGNVWTMNQTQVTVYTENGIRIFSKDPNQVKELKLESTKQQQQQNQLSQLESWNEKNCSPELKKFFQILKKENYNKFQEEEKQKEKPKQSNIPPTPPPLPAAVQIKLKGSYITTVDANQRVYYLIPGYIVSYEPKQKRFYVLNFQFNQQTNVFPCLVSVSNELDLYKQNSIHQVSGVSQNGEKQFTTALIQKLLQNQQFRYDYPWRLNDWEFAYAFTIKEIESRTQNSQNEEDKKKLRSEKAKYIPKLIKVIEHSKKQRGPDQKMDLRELRKSFMLCINGDLQELSLINQLLKMKVSQEFFTISLHLLNFWVVHSDQTIGYSKEGFNLLGEVSGYLLSSVKSIQQKDDTYQQIMNLVVRGHKLFLNTNKQQVEWFDYLIQDGESLKWFCIQFVSDQSSLSKGYYLKDSKIEYEPKLDKEITVQSEIIQLYPKIQVHANQSSFVEAWTRLLITDIAHYSKQPNSKNHFFKSFYIENMYKEGDKPLTEEEINNHKSQSQRFRSQIRKALQFQNGDIIRFVGVLFSDGWNELSKIEDGQLEWNLKTSLASYMLSVYEEVLHDLRGVEAKFELLNVICQQMSSIFQYLFSSSVTQQPQDCEITNELIKIFTTMKDFLDYHVKDTKENPNQVVNLLSREDIHIPRSPGVDQTNDKVFETAHPYERGKPQLFEETHFPGALALCVDFDQKCSSDPNHDFLSINSWYSSHCAQGGITQQLRDPVGISYRISGKPSVRRPIVLLGNCIQVDFHPSGQARNEHSLNRWGFRINVRPIYGLKKSGLKQVLKGDNLQHLLRRFEEPNNIVVWVNTLRILQMLILDSIAQLVGMDEIRTTQELNNTKLMKWTLLKNGPINFNIDSHLVKQPATNLYTLVNKLDFQDSMYLKTMNGPSFSQKGSKEQQRYWQMKRELFRINYRQTFNIVTDQIAQCEELLNKQDLFQTLWDEVLENNSIVNEQVKQVRTRKGEFFDFAVALTKKFTDSFAYRQEKMLRSFREVKDLWQQVEVLIVLVVLYHSGLMHIHIPNIEVYLQGNLSSLSDARNECVNYMMKKIRTEKEWQQNVETIDQNWVTLLEQNRLDADTKQKDQLLKEQQQKEQEQEKEKNISPKPPQLDGVFVKQGNQLKFISKSKKKQLKKKPSSKPPVPNQKKSKDDDSDQDIIQEQDIIAQPEQKIQTEGPKRLITSEIEKQLWQSFHQRLEGNTEMVESLCQLRGVSFDPEQINEAQKLLFQDLCNVLSDKESSDYKYMMQNPYQKQAQNLIKKSLLLLLVNNVRLEEKIQHLSTKQSEGSVDSESIGGGRQLKPPGVLGRSVSHQLDEKQVDSQKLLKFRLWLDSYQKWKQLHSVPISDELGCESPDVPPVKSVVQFLKSEFGNDSQIVEIMKMHDKRCVRRVVGLQLLNIFTDACGQNGILSPLVQGGVLCNGDLLTSKIELGSSGAKQLLLTEIVKRINYLLQTFNKLTEQARGLNLVLVQQKESDNLDVTIIEQMKLLHVNVTEINQLLSVNNNQLWAHPSFCEQALNTELFGLFVENAIQTALLNSIFVSMTQQYQSVSLLAQHILNAIKHTLFLIVDNGLPKHITMLLDTLLKVIKQEIGLHETKVNARLLVKLNDQIGVTRISLLLSHLYDIVLVHQRSFEGKAFTNVHDVISLLILMIYHSQIPVTIKNIVKILKLLFSYGHIDLKLLQSPLTKEYIWQTVNLDSFIDKFQSSTAAGLSAAQIKKIQLKFEVKKLEYNHPQSSIIQNPEDPLLLLIWKLGRIIAVEGDLENSIELAIAQELAVVTSKMKPQRQNKKPQVLGEEQRYKVLVQVCDDEEISHLIRVLYYWEELYPTITPRLPKTIEEYQELREKEKKRDEQKAESKEQVQANLQAQPDQKAAQYSKALSQYRVLERVLLTHPDVVGFDDKDEKTLNLGWGFNYSNLFGDMKLQYVENRKQSTSMKKSVKKNWNLPNTEELERRYEELIKQSFDIKSLKTKEEIDSFLLQRNFLRRMYQHIQEVMYFSRQLQVYGYCAFTDTYPLEKAQELAQLVKLSLEGKLEPIPILHLPEEFGKKVDPNPFIMVGSVTVKEQPLQKKQAKQEKQQPPVKDQPSQPKATNNKSNMVVCLIEACHFVQYEFRLDYITLLPQQGQPGQGSQQMQVVFYNEANRAETFGQTYLNGAIASQLTYQLVNLLGFLAQNNPEMQQLVKQTFEQAIIKDNKKESNKFDELFVVGLSTMFGGWAQQIAPSLPAQVKHFKQDNENLYIVEGGLSCGQKQCQLISDQDDKLNVQCVKIEDVQMCPQVTFDVSRFLEKQHYHQLLQNIIIIDQSLTSFDQSQRGLVKNQLIILRNLQLICGRLDWTSYINSCLKPESNERELFARLLPLLKQLSSKCLFDRTDQEYEQEFCTKWERLIDRQSTLNQAIVYPFALPDFPQLKIFTTQKTQQKVGIEQCLVETFKEEVLKVSLVPSSYVSSLPEAVIPQNEHKMLRYWENYIIPKMQDYVRGSLKPWEFEDFFEQIRQPLRKGDQAKALEISYIICDQRLPNGVVVPDANHDWSTLNIEEIIMGQMVIARLSDKGTEQTYSKVLSQLKKQGISYVLGQVIGIEMRSSSVLVMHPDTSKAVLQTTWFPSSALKCLQIYIPPPASSFPQQQIFEEFFKALQLQISLKSLALLMQLTHGKSQLQAYSLIKELNIQLIDIVELAVKEELQGACIDAWIKQQGNTVKLPQLKNKQEQSNNYITIGERTEQYLLEVQSKIQTSQSRKNHKLKDIQNYMDQLDTINTDQLIDWLQTSFENVAKFLKSNQKCMDLTKTQVKGQPVQINFLQDSEHVSGLCIVFMNDSVLCQCSGLRFYSDPQGISNFKTIAAGKENKHKLNPLTFDKKSVYCEYFFNAEALPLYQQEKCQSSLQCLVYPIPSSWNTCCWISDTLATSLIRSNRDNSLSQLQRIMQILQNVVQQITGPHILVQSMFKLIMRTTTKLRWLIMNRQVKGNHFELMALQRPFLNSCIENVKQLQEFQKQELSGLYSSYVQDLSEMIAVSLSPLTNQPVNEIQIPTWINSYCRLLTLMEFLKGGRSLTDDLTQEVSQMLRIDNQWENIIIIKNLPLEITRTQIGNIIEKQKGRVYNPLTDIQISEDGMCIILIDGWASLDLEEKSQDLKRKEEELALQQIEQQEQKELVQQESQQEEEKVWNCTQCTLENRFEANQCEICGAEAPPNKGEVQKSQQLQVEPEPKVDMNEEEKQMAQKDKDRFQALVDALTNCTNEHFLQLKAKNQEEIKQLQTQIAIQNQLLNPKIEQVPTKQPTQTKPPQPPPPPHPRQIQQQQKVGKKKGNSRVSSQQKIQQVEKDPEQKIEIITVEQQPLPPTKEEIQNIIKPLQERLDLIVALEFVNTSSVLAGKQILESDIIKQYFTNRLMIGKPSELYRNLSQEVIKVLKSLFKRTINDTSFLQVLQENSGKYLNSSSIEHENDLLWLVDKQSSINSLQVWRFFESLGYDFWLDHVCLYKKQKVSEALSPAILQQLIQFIETDVCKETKVVLSYQPISIRFPEIVGAFKLQDDTQPINYGEYITSIAKFKELANSPLCLVRVSWALLRLMNQSLDETGVFINMDIPNNQPTSIFKPGTLLLQTSEYISTLRAFYMQPIKSDLVHKVLNKTALSRDGTPKLSVERLKLARDQDNLKKQQSPVKEVITLNHKDDFLFTKAYEQMKEVASTQLRPVKPTGTDPFLAFEINFRGEDVQGESGPYRQFYADISKELQPPLLLDHNLNLLCQSTNNVAKIGNAKDKFVINPSARSTYHLQLFEFLGVLMGCSVRTATHFTLDLPQMFWKHLVCESIKADDVEEVDATMCSMIQFMEECTQEMFESKITENWVTLRSDRTVQELKRNGSKLQVQFHERGEYIDKVLQVKITESELSTNALKKGLASIIPTPLLNLITAKDLELWVCGRARVDVDLLRRHTRYAGDLNDASPRIKFFWEALAEFSEQEKLRFVKFCWGQERLPANDEEFERNQIRFMIKPATFATNQPDKVLPKADTCFFNIELPKYSSKEILKHKLLTAINFDCDSMNAEQRVSLDPNQRYRRRSGDSDMDIDENPGDGEEEQE